MCRCVCVCVCVVVVEIFQNAMFDYQRLLAITNLYWTNNCYPIDVIPSHHPRSTDGLILWGFLLKPVCPHFWSKPWFPVKIFPNPFARWGCPSRRSSAPTSPWPPPTAPPPLPAGSALTRICPGISLGKRRKRVWKVVETMGNHGNIMGDARECPAAAVSKVGDDY